MYTIVELPPVKCLIFGDRHNILHFLALFAAKFHQFLNDAVANE